MRKINEDVIKSRSYCCKPRPKVIAADAAEVMSKVNTSITTRHQVTAGVISRLCSFLQ